MAALDWRHGTAVGASARKDPIGFATDIVNKGVPAEQLGTHSMEDGNVSISLDPASRLRAIVGALAPYAMDKPALLKDLEITHRLALPAIDTMPASSLRLLVERLFRHIDAEQPRLATEVERSLYTARAFRKVNRTLGEDGVNDGHAESQPFYLVTRDGREERTDVGLAVAGQGAMPSSSRTRVRLVLVQRLDVPSGEALDVVVALAIPIQADR